MAFSALILLIQVLFLGQLFFCHELPGSSIPVNTILQAKDSWISRDGTFAIGLNQNTLAIWYRHDPSIIVWKATSSSGSLEQVSSNSNLALRADGLYAGEILVWICGTGCTVGRASMEDSGNFVLYDSNDRKRRESFTTPTDTLLAGQPFVGENTFISSKSGKFKLRLIKNAAQLESVDFQVPAPDYVNYWSLYNPKISNFSDTRLNKDPSFNLSSDGVLRFRDAAGNVTEGTEGNKGTIQYTSDYPSNRSRRIVLENNGNLRIYSMTPQNTSEIVWQAVFRECHIYTFCGDFGICSYSPTAKCNCPPGFSTSKSKHDGSCDRNVPLVSNASKLIELVSTDYDYNDFQSPVLRQSIDMCKNLCLKEIDCLAAAYKLNGNGGCYLKGQTDQGTSGKLVNGRQAVDTNTIVFLKVSANDPTLAHYSPPNAFKTNVTGIYLEPSLKDKEVKKQSFFGRTAYAISLAVGVAEFVIFIIVCTAMYFSWQKEKRRMVQKYKIDIEGAPAKFYFKELQSATDNFSEKLGVGSFGSVYRGTLPDGRVIAVKQLDGAVQGEKQFKAEVSTIGKIHHINLVRLLGYCAERHHRLLVLEFMPNGSLEKLLFNPDNDESTKEWTTRYSIALGIARGITYLHEECHECILHCDIKPQNILLDDQFCPKVSDFGLAKLVDRERPFTVTTIAGTRGYVAPEWVSNLQITSKVDVYSFGMVLLEILSGKFNFSMTPSSLQEDRFPFPSFAFQKYEQKDLSSIADSKLEREGIDWKQFERVLKVAFWCIQRDMELRPSMSKVVQMLEDNIQVEEPLIFN